MKVALEWSEVKVRLGDLIPNPDNPKYSTEASAKRLTESLETLGQFETIAVDFDGVSAVDGHQRLNAWIATKGEDFVVDAKKPNRKLTKQEVRKIILLSGKGTHGLFDMGMLALHFDDTELADFGGFGLEDLPGYVPDTSSELDEDNPGDTYVETHSVIVLCTDSDHQERVFNKLTEQGMNCKVVSN